MTPRRGRGPRALAALLPDVARKSLRSGGATLARLITDWPTVIGEKLAQHCVPRRLIDRAPEGEGATLVLAARGPVAIELQHLEPVLIERINGHLGYGAIKRIRLVQDAPPKARVRASRHVVPTGPSEASPPAVDIVEDEELRAALARLGSAVVRSTRSGREP
jgi:hypothetical protein